MVEVEVRMKLEFMGEAGPDRNPTLLLYGSEAEVVRALAATLTTLTEEGVELSALPGVEAVDACRVRVQRGGGTGIRCTGPNAFTWQLTEGTLDHVLGFLEPFMDGSTEDGFQWLEQYGEIDFIISRGRYF
ncbi:MAG: hypothetical protein QM767_19870 [Anaeromyxobacter sp.]